MEIPFDTKEIFTYSELADVISKSGLSYDLSLIENAFNFANEKHAGQKRKSGEDYIMHPLTVAKYVVASKLDTVSVMAALLHDTVEDCEGVTIEDLEKRFGVEVAFIVDGLTEITDLTDKGAETNDIETFRKMILKSAEDIRIIMIKLCDKLHNTYTLGSFPVEKQKASAKKVQNIWEPLAEYLGMWKIKRALQELVLKILEPDGYAKSLEVYRKYVLPNIHEFDALQPELQEILHKYNVNVVEMAFRVKTMSSFYYKLKKKTNLDFSRLDQVLDIFAMRVIVSSVDECYLVAGIILEKYDVNMKEYDDYILKPRVSGYRSIHLNFKYNNTPVEIQIKTPEMHAYNEFGPASHFAYKVGFKEKDFGWTKELIDNSENKKYRADIFKDKIFVFTPKMKVITLNIDSVPIDFAYQVHTDIGDSYIGAKVNGKIVDAQYKLRTGDVVEILVDKNKKAPSLDLTKFARMAETRHRIRKARKKNKI